MLIKKNYFVFILLFTNFLISSDMDTSPDTELKAANDYFNIKDKLFYEIASSNPYNIRLPNELCSIIAGYAREFIIVKVKVNVRITKKTDPRNPDYSFVASSDTKPYFLKLSVNDTISKIKEYVLNFVKSECNYSHRDYNGYEFRICLNKNSGSNFSIENLIDLKDDDFKKKVVSFGHDVIAPDNTKFEGIHFECGVDLHSDSPLTRSEEDQNYKEWNR